MPRPKGSAELLEARRRQALRLLDEGYSLNEVGRMVGLELPVLAMEHQYFITEDLPQLKGRPQELVHVIDFEGEIYTR